MSKKKIDISKEVKAWLVVGIVTALGFFFLMMWGIQLLWNFVMPVFGVTTLSYWQTTALFILVSLIINIIGNAIKNK